MRLYVKPKLFSLLIGLVGCSHLGFSGDGKGVFRSSAERVIDEAPMAMALPKDSQGEINDVYMQTKADYHFTLAESHSLQDQGFIDENAPKRTGFEHQGRREEDAFADLAARYPNATIREDDAKAEKMARDVFVDGEALPVALYGTPFRRQVWRALLEIPPGETQTYGALAKAAGSPKAARAVGAAVGANPISWFIPCHRALAADGRLHNYHWGVKRKRAMLAYEKVHAA